MCLCVCVCVCWGDWLKYIDVFIDSTNLGLQNSKQDYTLTS